MHDFVSLLGALPSLAWPGLALWALWTFREPIGDALGRVKGVEAFGVKFALAERAFEQAVEIAQKNPEWSVNVPAAARHAALDRARREQKLLNEAEILWVDDRPGNNRNEVRMFNAFGAFVTMAASTDESLEVLAIAKEEGQRRFHVILSDMKRGTEKAAGLIMLERFASAGVNLPVIFYVGGADPARGTPKGAVGITDRPDVLLQLVLDTLARARPGAAA